MKWKCAVCMAVEVRFDVIVVRQKSSVNKVYHESVLKSINLFIKRY